MASFFKYSSMTGPVVADLSRTFDRYWNSEAVWPISALLPDRAKPEDLVALRDALERHGAEPLKPGASAGHAPPRRRRRIQHRY